MTLEDDLKKLGVVFNDDLEKSKLEIRAELTSKGGPKGPDMPGEPPMIKLPKHLSGNYCADHQCIHKRGEHGREYKNPNRICTSCGNTVLETECPFCEDRTKTKKIKRIEIEDGDDIEYEEE